MSRRVGDGVLGVLFAGVGLAGLGVAAAISYFDGSANVAWGVASMSAGFIIIAPLEAFGVGDWLWRATPRARSAVAGAGILIATGGTALYIFTDSIAAWWLAPIASFPVIYLFFQGDGGSHDGGQMEGPYTPPDPGA